MTRSQWKLIEVPEVSNSSKRFEDVCIAGDRLYAIHQSRFLFVLDLQNFEVLEKKELASFLPEGDGDYPRCITFDSNGIRGFIGLLRNEPEQSDRLLSTSDGGRTWSPSDYLPAQCGPEFGICGIDVFDGEESAGDVVGVGTYRKADGIKRSGIVVLSRKEGSWSQPVIAETGVDVLTLSSDVAVAAGAMDGLPAVWTTQDSGTSWQLLNLNFPDEPNEASTKSRLTGTCWKIYREGSKLTISTSLNRPYSYLISSDFPGADNWEVTKLKTSANRVSNLQVQGVATSGSTIWIGQGDRDLIERSSPTGRWLRAQVQGSNPFASPQKVNRIIQHESRLFAAGKHLYYHNL